jgi:hypothetical protein
VSCEGSNQSLLFQMSRAAAGEERVRQEAEGGRFSLKLTRYISMISSSRTSLIQSERISS